MYFDFDDFGSGFWRVRDMNHTLGAPAGDGSDVSFGCAFFGLVDGKRWELLKMPSFDSDAFLVCETKSFKFVGRNRIAAWDYVGFPVTIPTISEESEG